MRIRSRSSLGIAVAIGALAVAVTAQGANPDQVLVCHGTAASAPHGYVLIKVSRNALNGHFDLVGQDFVPTGHGTQNGADEWSELEHNGFTTEVCRDLYKDAYGDGVGPD